MCPFSFFFNLHLRHVISNGIYLFFFQALPLPTKKSFAEVPNLLMFYDKAL